MSKCIRTLMPHCKAQNKTNDINVKEDGRRTFQAKAFRKEV